MIKAKKLNYFFIFSLVIGCWLFAVGLTQGQTSQAGITLTWSTDTYIPLGYQGKALPVRGSNIEVAANIDEPKISPQNTIYSWFINDYPQKDGSGLGKQVFKFNTNQSINETNIIRLEINNINGVLLGIGYLSIETQEPEIVLQAKNQSSIINSVISGAYKISANQEIEFIAQPYFFNISNINELNYQWDFNGQKGSEINGNNPNTLILKINELTESVKQKLTIFAENKNNKIQRTQKTIEITLTP